MVDAQHKYGGGTYYTNIRGVTQPPVPNQRGQVDICAPICNYSHNPKCTGIPTQRRICVQWRTQVHWSTHIDVRTQPRMLVCNTHMDIYVHWHGQITTRMHNHTHIQAHNDAYGFRHANIHAHTRAQALPYSYAQNYPTTLTQIPALSKTWIHRHKTTHTQTHKLDSGAFCIIHFRFPLLIQSPPAHKHTNWTPVHFA